jgi:hypothetical protein
MAMMADWNKTLCEAIGRIQTRYDYIGRMTGTPFLAVMYPPDIEEDVFKEWDTLVNSLKNDFSVKDLDLLEITQEVLHEIGVDTVLDSINNPEPGCNPEQDLGNLWLTEISKQVRDLFESQHKGRPVVVLKRLAALYPVVGPQEVMQRLWDIDHECLNGPVIFLIPGTLIESRRYLFLNQKDEFMYRGDIL